MDCKGFIIISMGEEAETAGWPGVSTIHLGKPEIPVEKSNSSRYARLGVFRK